MTKALLATLAVFIFLTSPIQSYAIEITQSSIEQGAAFANKDTPKTVLFPATNYATQTTSEKAIFSNSRQIWSSLRQILNNMAQSQNPNIETLSSLETILKILKASDKNAYNAFKQVSESSLAESDTKVTGQPVDLTAINQERFDELISFLRSLPSYSDLVSFVSFIPQNGEYNKAQIQTQIIQITNLEAFEAIFSYLSSASYILDIKSTSAEFDKLIAKSIANSGSHQGFSTEDYRYSKNIQLERINSCNIAIKLQRRISVSGGNIVASDYAFSQNSEFITNCRNQSDNLTHKLAITIPALSYKAKSLVLKEKVMKLSQSLSSAKSERAVKNVISNFTWEAILLQPFEDTNKRVFRMYANLLLMAYGMAPAAYDSFMPTTLTKPEWRQQFISAQKKGKILFAD